MHYEPNLVAGVAHSDGIGRSILDCLVWRRSDSHIHMDVLFYAILLSWKYYKQRLIASEYFLFFSLRLLESIRCQMSVNLIILFVASKDMKMNFYCCNVLLWL